MTKISGFRRLITGYSFLLLASCHEGGDHAKTALEPEVQFIIAGQQTVPVYTEYVGQTFGESDVQIQPRVQGLITGIYFKEGQRVEKGSLLYTIDDLSIRTEIGGYRADLAKARTVLANKAADLDRIRPLADMKALSQHDLDGAVADYQSAKSEVDISEARLADMQIQWDYTRMKAPISGIIGISNVNVGDYVGGPGQAVMNTISATSGIKVRFPVSENDYLRFIGRMKKETVLRQGLPDLPVELILADGSVYPEKGRLQLANRQVDHSTGSLLVEARFSNPLQVLKPGQYVKARLRTDLIENAVLVPQQAISQLQDIYQVYVLSDSNKVIPRQVKPGPRVGSNWIIREGLHEGERVAFVGNAFINPNLPVKPVPATWSRDSAENKDTSGSKDRTGSKDTTRNNH